jgi:Domain of unknown function (DUF4410)
MRAKGVRSLGVRLMWWWAVMMAAGSSSKAQPIAASNPDIPQVPAYINDFELGVRTTNAPAAPSMPTQTGANATKKPDGTPASQPVALETDPPHVQARKIQDFFANTLTQLLQKAGLPAKRQEAGRPDYGVQVRGVFAEFDPMNRVRKAVIGGPSPGGKWVLYVATYNLARPDQPLYQPASEQDHDQKYGPIITLNSYVPMEKYEVSKDPTEEDVRNICGQIVNNLVQLIKRNVVAFEH